MIHIFSFLLIFGLLTAEGFLLFTAISRTRGERLIALLLGYPLGALLNALIFFALNIFNIPFGILSVGISHALIIAGLYSICRNIRNFDSINLSISSLPPRKTQKVLVVVCVSLLAAVLIGSSLKAIFIPSYYWDIFYNWAMQAKQYYFAGEFLTEGVQKPHYPVLLRTIQMVHMLIPGWSDTLSNASTLALSFTIFGSLFVFIKRIVSTECALITCTFFSAIPIAVIHMEQGYADIHLAGYLLLSALLLEQALKNNNTKLLTISSLLCAGAAWTKMEGFYFGVMPWIAFVGIDAFLNKRWKSNLLYGIIPLILIAIAWPIWILSQGLLLTPNETGLGFYLADYKMILRKMFIFGSFGVHWYAITAGLLLLIPARNRMHMQSWRMILWGIGVVLLLIGIYLFTEEVKWLRQRTAFTRAMIFPTMLLTQALAMHYYRIFRPSTPHQP